MTKSCLLRLCDMSRGPEDEGWKTESGVGIANRAVNCCIWAGESMLWMGYLCGMFLNQVSYTLLRNKQPPQSNMTQRLFPPCLLQLQKTVYRINDTGLEIRVVPLLPKDLLALGRIPPRRLHAFGTDLLGIPFHDPPSELRKALPDDVDHELRRDEAGYQQDTLV